MADKKISQLQAASVAALGDLLPMVDISEANILVQTKKVTIQLLKDVILAGGLDDLLGYGDSTGAHNITLGAQAVSRVLVTDGSGVVTSSSVGVTQLGYIATVTSDVQTQLTALETRVNALETGLTWKAIVKIIADAPIALTGTYTSQGYALQVGDRVLAAAQASAPTNGIYIVAAGAWTRATDFDGSGDQMQGAVIPCEQGTYADKAYNCTNTGPIVIGSTPITFVRWGGTIYTGTTNRISVSGNVIDIDSAYVGQATITTLGTITTGTLGSGAKILIGSDATGDVWYNGGSGAIARSAEFNFSAGVLFVGSYATNGPISAKGNSQSLILDSAGTGSGTQIAIYGTSSILSYLGANATNCLTVYDSTAGHLWLSINNTTGVTTLNDLITKSATPAIAAGTGAGTSPTISISGTNKGGVIDLTTGVAPSVSGIVATITFSGSLSAPNDIAISLTPRNSNGVVASAVYAVKVNATSWKIVEASGLGLTGAKNYIWNYSTEVI